MCRVPISIRSRIISGRWTRSGKHGRCRGIPQSGLLLHLVSARRFFMAWRFRRNLLLDCQCPDPSLGRGQLECHGVYVELLEPVLQRDPHGARFRGQHRPRARQHHQSRPARPLQVRVEVPAGMVLLVPASHVRAVCEDRQTPFGGYGLRRLPACSLRRVCRVCLPASERGRRAAWTTSGSSPRSMDVRRRRALPGRHLESPSACPRASCGTAIRIWPISRMPTGHCSLRSSTTPRNASGRPRRLGT